MKQSHLFTTLFVILFHLPVQGIAQLVAETVYKIEQTYSPLLSKNESGVELRLLKNYELGNTDTSFAFTVRVISKTALAVGGVGSFAFSGYGWSRVLLKPMSTIVKINWSPSIRNS